MTYFFTYLFYLINLFFFIFSAEAKQEALLTWDDLQTATGLHVYARGKDKSDTLWTAHEVKIEETAFYQELFNTPEVFSTMGAGTGVSQAKMADYVQFWTGLFSNGIPRARMTIEQNSKPIGCVQLAGKAGSPGVGELIRALKPSAQSQGLGKELLKFVVREWAPALRNVALSQYTDAPPSAIDKFKCFEGEALHTIYTTSRPSNIKSWKSYTYFDFLPSQPQQDDHTISCIGWEQSLNGSLEEYIVNKYFSADSLTKLQEDVLYPMLDENEELRTLSYVSIYNSPRYHFMHNVK